MLTDDEKAPCSWRFAVDRGGTFTDVVGFGPDGALHTAKVLSRDPLHPDDPGTPGHPRAARRARRPGTSRGRSASRHHGRDQCPARTQRCANVARDVDRDARRTAHRLPGTTRRSSRAQIRRPPPLYRDVVAVRERVDADGRVLQALDEAGLLAVLVAARAAGVESVAIAFLHGLPLSGARAARRRARAQPRASTRSSPRTKPRRCSATSHAARPRSPTHTCRRCCCATRASSAPTLARRVRRTLGDVHAEQRRTRGCRGPAGRQRSAVRARGWCRGHDRRGHGRRAAPADRFRHGRHVDGRQSLRRARSRAASSPRSTACGCRRR